MSSISPTLPPLGRIGPWLVVRRLGRGGVASVYEVIEPERGERAALKLFRRPGAPDRSVQREYRALAGLDHPGIVRVFGCGRIEQTPYLLMELIVGRSSQAQARLAGAPGSPQRCGVALRIVHDLVEALAYLHGRGIVHRDIKSSNVLSTSTGHMKLLDLGIAGFERRDGNGAYVPGLERFAGTVVYASPEQLRGQALDGRSDLFSVGVLWYRMLTGELPFPAANREQAVVERERGAPLAPHLRVPGVSPEASQVVASLLAVRAADRPRNAAALLGRLRPLLATRGARRTALRPAPPPLFGRKAVHGQLERFMGGEGPDGIGLLDGPQGVGHEELLHWVVLQARRAGHRTLVVDPLGESAGGLLSGLLLAVPRHVRGRRRGSADSHMDRVMGVLERLTLAQGRPALLVLGGLERLPAAQLHDLVGLQRRVVERGLPVRILASWCAGEPDLHPALEGIEPPLSRFSLWPLDEASASMLLRSMAEGRVLPPGIRSAVLRAGRGRPVDLARALEEAVDAGRLRLGQTPEGTPCWLEVLSAVDEPVGDPAGGLAALMARGADEPPWDPPKDAPVVAGALEPLALVASEPEEHPDPRLRAVLFAWRGHARSLLGDRDLQADADLLQAEEGLRSALRDGWEPAEAWRGYLALVRVGQLANRGRHIEARRRLGEVAVRASAGRRGHRRDVAELALATAEGEPLPPASLEREVDGLVVSSPVELRAAWAKWLLQRGELSSVLELHPRGLSDDPSAWDAPFDAQIGRAAASALVLRGQLREASAYVGELLDRLGPCELGPPRALLHVAMAEIELELFRPGVAREQLADAFVLLRHCDRPEIAAERECARGRLSLACGEPARAEAAFRTGLDLTRGTGFHVLAARMECWLARALARTGRRREATALLGPAMERLGAAGAMPALAVGCGARWEAGGFVEDPDLCYQPVAAWLEAEQALLPWLDWCVARLRHAAMHRDLGRVARVKEETAALQRRVLAGLGEDERRLLSMRARYRALA